MNARTQIPRGARLLLGVALVALAATVAREAFGVVWLWQPAWEWAYDVAEFAAMGACALRAVHGGAGERAAWGILAAGLAAFGMADVYYTVVLASMASPPYPSPADAGYIAIYPCAYAALVLLLRRRAGRVSSALWLDGLMSALSVAGLGAALVFGVVASTDGPLAAVATNLAYPLGDLVLFAFVVAIVTVSRRRARRTWGLLALGFGVFAVADTFYLWETALGTYRENTLLDSGWPTSFVLIAFAAWQPAMAMDARRLRGTGMLVLPAGLALASVGILVADHYARINSLAVWFAASAVGVLVLRFMLAFRENVRLLHASEEEATTDALTGLGNRRKLINDLSDAAADPAEGCVDVVALFDLDGFKAYNDAFGHPAGDALLVRLGRRLAAELSGDARAYRMGGDEFCLLARVPDADVAARLVARAERALSEQGDGFRVTSSSGRALLPEETDDPIEAVRIADERMYAAKRGGRQDADETVSRVLMRVLAEHEGALLDRLGDVARMAERVAQHLGLSEAAVTQIRRAAQLHDIGKVAIPDAILDAPRALQADEWEYMRQHTLIGARIIGTAPNLLAVATIVRGSHERFDGAGYPDRLAGEDIPLGARIVAVCDAYDAMTTDRPYRRAGTTAEALAELRACAGTQFDPRIVASLDAVLRDSVAVTGQLTAAA